MRCVRAVWHALLDFVYPAHCLLCRSPLGAGYIGICPSCRTGLEIIDGPVCDRCGCPLGQDQVPCPNCSEKVFSFEKMRALAPFNPNVQRLVHMLKYEGRTLAGRVLGNDLGLALGRSGIMLEGSVIVPVPLHASRRRERGYNQSALIGRAVARVLCLPVDAGVLRRVRLTQTQTALDLAGRAANVHGAFLVRRNTRVAGKTVLLVDDVITTGATANACADALMAAGAERVLVAAAASPYRVAV